MSTLLAQRLAVAFLKPSKIVRLDIGNVELTLSLERTAQVLGEIRNSIAEAEKLALFWEGWLANGQEVDLVERDFVCRYVERAFVQTIVLLEWLNMPGTLSEVQRLKQQAEKDYAETRIVRDLYLVWVEKLRNYLDALERMHGQSDTPTVTKDLVEILRATQYSITDCKCFPHPPAREEDVRIRIDAVLRCVFPDLVSKPRIAKSIKNFEPDTGLLGYRTLIEYKYIENDADAKRVADEVLADTRGYCTPEWERFVYVIYETKRIKQEKQWMTLLRQSGVPDTTSVVVISGEKPEAEGANV